MRPLLLLPFVVLVAGCHGSEDTGIDQSAVDSFRTPFAAAAKRAGGDWDKLTPEDRKLFMDQARGNEAGAKTFFGMMAGGTPKVEPPKR